MQEHRRGKDFWQTGSKNRKIKTIFNTNFNEEFPSF